VNRFFFCAAIYETSGGCVLEGYAPSEQPPRNRLEQQESPAETIVKQSFSAAAATTAAVVPRTRNYGAPASPT